MIQNMLSKLSAKPYKPHAYQQKGIKFLLSQAAAGLFLDPGLGKTSISLAAIKILKKRKMGSKTLLIAPLRVCHSVWPNEIEKWLDFHELSYVILHGPKKDELLKEDVDIYVINPEGLDWLLQPDKVKRGKKTSVNVDVRRFKKLGFDILLIDELTKFKNYQSIRFKAIKQVLHTFARRWGLTGSPAANGLMDLFGQMYMLDQGRSLGGYITHYRRNYFTPSFNGFSYDLKDGAEELIYQAIQPVVLRMSAEDYLELPQLVENVMLIDMPPDAREIYDQLEDDLLVQLEGGYGTLTAKNSGVALGKCRQVASGAIYKESGLGEVIKTVKAGRRDWILVHDQKLDALEELVEELQGAPLLVAYEFNHDLDRLRDRFGKDLPYIGSGISGAEGRRLEKLWNEGKIPVLAVHPMSVAHGLNLQESGQHIAWFTLTWDYELFDQLIRRLLRQGSKNKRIFNHILIMKDTVEEMVLGAIRSKKKGQNSLFEGLKALQKQRKGRK